MSMDRDQFQIEDSSAQIAWAVEACARIILGHPEVSAAQIEVIGKLIRFIENLPNVVLENPVSIGLRLERHGIGLRGGNFIQLNVAHKAMGIVSGWWEYDPEIDGDHQTTVLCECEASGFSEVAEDLQLLPQEFEGMIEEGAEIFLEGYEQQRS